MTVLSGFLRSLAFGMFLGLVVVLGWVLKQEFDPSVFFVICFTVVAVPLFVLVHWLLLMRVDKRFEKEDAANRRGSEGSGGARPRRLFPERGAGFLAGFAGVIFAQVKLKPDLGLPEFKWQWLIVLAGIMVSAYAIYFFFAHRRKPKE